MIVFSTSKLQNHAFNISLHCAGEEKNAAEKQLVSEFKDEKSNHSHMYSLVWNVQNYYKLSLKIPEKKKPI